MNIKTFTSIWTNRNRLNKISLKRKKREKSKKIEKKRKNLYKI